MSMRSRAALGGAVLAVAVAPVAEGATRRADLRLTSLSSAPATVQAGSQFSFEGRVANRANRRASSGRVTYTLRDSPDARRGLRLGGTNVKRTKGGSRRSFEVAIRVPLATPASTYYLFACVRRGSGEGRARCRNAGRVTITAASTPGAATAPAAAPAASPAPDPGPAPDTRSPAEKLRDGVNADGMFEHLEAWQTIANANGGNRASGFPGYDASAQYVVDQLEGAGYDATVQVFDFVLFRETTPPVFQKTAPAPEETYEPDDDDDPSDVDFYTMSYSAAGETTDDLQAVDVNLAANPDDRTSTSGCEDADFAGFTAGNVALIQRGTCTFYDKTLNAQEAGASGVVIFNQGNNAGRMDVVAGTLGETAQDGQGGDFPDITIPSIGISYALGEELANTAGARVHVKVDAVNLPRTSHNVLADTAGGDPDHVVVVGSHLDSVEEGAGINDNGSGSSFNLELALQMAEQGIEPVNKVRFAFWGAEESGLVGATRYMEFISQEDFEKLAMNLNFDMIGSPNYARFVYDGDFSHTPPPATAPDVNPGAAEIEQAFVSYFRSRGQASGPSAFDGRSDYKPFQDNGIAAGGLFTGAEQAKTAAQRDRFGGISNTAFDPNYHQAGDDIGNVNRTGLEEMADAGAFVAGSYATDAGAGDRFNPGRMSLGARAKGKSVQLGRFLQR